MNGLIRLLSGSATDPAISAIHGKSFDTTRDALVGLLQMNTARTAVLAMIVAGPVLAQNSDLGVLLNASVNRFHLGPRTETQYRIGVQVNYAWQVLERAAGRLYIEVPVSSFSGPVGQSVTEEVNGLREVRRPELVLFGTPGVRYHIHLTPRLALYVAAGAGIALRQQKITTMSDARTEPGVFIAVASRRSWTGSPAFNIGGGLDFRLTRLLSLRGELRTFRTSELRGFGSGQNYPSAHVGLGFHF